MTTMELIERGIGHNCLSDAYDLGRADEQIHSIENAKQIQHDCLIAIEKARADEREKVIEEFKQKSYDIIGETIHNSNLELNNQLTLYAQIMTRIDRLEVQLKEQGYESKLS